MKTNQLRTVMFVLLVTVVSLGSVSAQFMKVRGTVVDKVGEPLVGVNINVMGNNSGTLTDVKGSILSK